MLKNIFNKSKSEKIQYNLKDNMIHKFGLTSEDGCFDIMNLKTGKTLIIKALDYEPNLKYYNIVIANEIVSIKKALEYLKSTLDTDITILVDKKNLPLISELRTDIKVLTCTDKDISNIDALIKKLTGKNEFQNGIEVKELLYLVYLGQKLLNENPSVILSVFGNAVEGNKVIKVPSNTTIRDVFNYLNGKEEDLKSIVSGGVYTGQGVYDLNRRIAPFDRSLIFSSKINNKKEISCIRCSKCLRVCPKKLNPIRLRDRWNRDDKEEFIKLGGTECINCGKCSYVCPSNIELAHTIKVANNRINKS